MMMLDPGRDLQLVGDDDRENSAGYLEKLGSSEKAWTNSIGYATGRQRKQLRNFAKSENASYARLPGGGFRIRDGLPTVPASDTKREPAPFELSQAFPDFHQEHTAKKMSPPPLMLGDYRSTFFRCEPRLICWDLNQMSPWEKVQSRIQCAQYTLNTMESGNCSHLAALSPRAASRLHWRRRILSQADDAWTRLPRTWIRVSSKKDALLDMLRLASKETAISSILVITRNKRLVRSIKLLLPEITIYVADFRSESFCHRTNIFSALGYTSASSSSQAEVKKEETEFCLYRSAHEVISSIVEKDNTPSPRGTFATMRQQQKKKAGGGSAFIGGRRFFQRKRQKR